MVVQEYSAFFNESLDEITANKKWSGTITLNHTILYFSLSLRFSTEDAYYSHMQRKLLLNNAALGAVQLLT
jgi:hypothetical protein